MLAYDIRAEIFELTDTILSDIIPTYYHQLEEMNIKLDYFWLDALVQKHLKISMEDRAVWYLSLEEVIDHAVEDGQLTENDREDFLLQFRLNVKLSQ